VIVEASGIATPDGVLDTIRQYPPETLGSLLTVTVVDPLRFEALWEVLTPLIEGQMTGADCLVVTKAGEAAPAELDLARRAAADLAPAAPVFVVDSLQQETLDEFLAWVNVDGSNAEPGT
jgi:G3E family GTPase